MTMSNLTGTITSRRSYPSPRLFRRWYRHARNEGHARLMALVIGATLSTYRFDVR